MAKTKEKYPECEKLAAVSEKSQVVGQFIDWLRDEKEFHIYETVETDSDYPEDCQHMPIQQSIEQLLAEFFDINLNKVEKERQQILADLQKGK